MPPLVVVPTYLEAENLPELLPRLRAAVPDAHVLVVDDNSPDGTADVAERIGREVGGVEVLRRPAKRGLGSAYRAAAKKGIIRYAGLIDFGLIVVGGYGAGANIDVFTDRCIP